MPYIDVIHENDAEGDLKDIYDDIIRRRGKMSNIMRIHSLMPKAMERHMDMYLTIMFERSGLSRDERELIGVVVSAANNCAYCVNHHVEALNHYWKDGSRSSQAGKDFRSLGLDERALSMLEFAEKLTLHPGSMIEDDIKRMRDAGLSDQEILNVDLIAAYFNFVNRIVLGMGVEFSEEEVRGYRY